MLTCYVSRILVRPFESQWNGGLSLTLHEATPNKCSLIIWIGLRFGRTHHQASLNHRNTWLHQTNLSSSRSIEWLSELSVTFFGAGWQGGYRSARFGPAARRQTGNLGTQHVRVDPLPVCLSQNWNYNGQFQIYKCIYNVALWLERQSAHCCQTLCCQVWVSRTLTLESYSVPSEYLLGHCSFLIHFCMQSCV